MKKKPEFLDIGHHGSKVRFYPQYGCGMAGLNSIIGRLCRSYSPIQIRGGISPPELYGPFPNQIHFGIEVYRLSEDILL